MVCRCWCVWCACVVDVCWVTGTSVCVYGCYVWVVCVTVLPQGQPSKIGVRADLIDRNLSHLGLPAVIPLPLILTTFLVTFFHAAFWRQCL